MSERQTNAGNLDLNLSLSPSLSHSLNFCHVYAQLSLIDPWDFDEMNDRPMTFKKVYYSILPSSNMEPSLPFQYGRVESPLYSSNMEEGRALSTLPIWKSREPSLLFLESAGSPVGGPLIR